MNNKKAEKWIFLNRTDYAAGTGCGNGLGYGYGHGCGDGDDWCYGGSRRGPGDESGCGGGTGNGHGSGIVEIESVRCFGSGGGQVNG